MANRYESMSGLPLVLEPRGVLNQIVPKPSPRDDRFRAA